MEYRQHVAQPLHNLLCTRVPVRHLPSHLTIRQRKQTVPNELESPRRQSFAAKTNLPNGLINLILPMLLEVRSNVHPANRTVIGPCY
jgi:hypothetical protein